MNNTIRIFLLLVSAVAFSAAFVPVQDINPNGSSELSLLMRKMEKQLVDA